jgi:PqqD family protein of HPr-rel-A system
VKLNRRKPRRPHVEHPLRLAPGVATTPVSDGLMVMHERTGHTYHLNASATLMLEALLRGATDNDVASTVAERFGIPETTASADIAELLAQLQARKLVNR